MLLVLWPCDHYHKALQVLMVQPWTIAATVSTVSTNMVMFQYSVQLRPKGGIYWHVQTYATESNLTSGKYLYG